MFRNGLTGNEAIERSVGLKYPLSSDTHALSPCIPSLPLVFGPISLFSLFPPRLYINSTLIMPTVSTEAIVVGVGVAAAATYLFRDQIFQKSKTSNVPTIPSKLGDGSGDPRDFVAKMINGVSGLKIRFDRGSSFV